MQSATGGYGSYSWTYDGVGNRTAETTTPVGGSAITDTYAYTTTNNRITSITRGASTVRAFTYDNAGNLLTDNSLGGNKSYVYNRRNRLSQATVGALVYNYTYNAQEQLAVRTQASPAATTHFIHDIFGNVIAETAGGGATGASGTVREYIWLPEAEIAPTMGSRAGIDRPLAVVEAVNTVAPSVLFVHVDHLHRPVKMTSAAKATVWDAVWQPFGGLHSLTGTGTLSARLPGQWFQSETGLHYNWHRSYDPTLGRYTQTDPLGFVDGPSVYGYAGGSPQRFVDPDGLFSKEGFQIGGALGTAAGAAGGPPGAFGGRIIGSIIGGAAGYVLGELILSKPTKIDPLNPDPVPKSELDQPSDDEPDDRTVPKPDCPRTGCTCSCRADVNANIIGNSGRVGFTFATVTASDCRTAKKLAKRQATKALGLQPKHVKCRCTSR
ncbi:MAG: RHS repeat-associated core domain-containing protein [Hyphomicrobium aestuarii]|nr:RHS repeat-associated core domain-containing protein [Hyphomicrobium aestuarii]